jgi:hypothetical protein
VHDQHQHHLHQFQQQHNGYTHRLGINARSAESAALTLAAAAEDTHGMLIVLCVMAGTTKFVTSMNSGVTVGRCHSMSSTSNVSSSSSHITIISSSSSSASSSPA